MATKLPELAVIISLIMLGQRFSGYENRPLRYVLVGIGILLLPFWLYSVYDHYSKKDIASPRLGKSRLAATCILAAILAGLLACPLVVKDTKLAPAAKESGNVEDSLIVGVLEPDDKASVPLFEAFVEQCKNPQGVPPWVENALKEQPDFWGQNSKRLRDKVTTLIPPDALRVYLGSANLGATTRQHQVVLRAGNVELLTIHRNQDRLSVDAKLLNKDVIADIVNNEFHINRKSVTYWRYKSTPHSLVIYDNMAQEIFNIQYINRLTIKVRGQFRSPGKPGFMISENNMIVGVIPMVCNVSGNWGGSLFQIQ